MENLLFDVLNSSRDVELNSLIVDDILVSPDVVKDLAVVYSVMSEEDKIDWIDVHNQKISLTHRQVGFLIKRAMEQIKDIYFDYRSKKDNIKGSV